MVVLLHNVDTLELYEDAIRQATVTSQNAGTGGPTETLAEAHMHRPPSTDDVPGTSAQAGRGGGRVPRPRPTKAMDPAKIQRKLEHAQRFEAAAASRRASGAAREATRLHTIMEHPSGAPLDNIEHHPRIPAQLTEPQPTTKEEHFYDTEVDDNKELQLSGSQISGAKEARADQPEGEVDSKRTKTATLPNPASN